MGKNTSFVLGERFDSLIADQVESGRYGSAVEVVREAMRLFERREQRRKALLAALLESEQSGGEHTHEEAWAQVSERHPWVK